MAEKTAPNPEASDAPVLPTTGSDPEKHQRILESAIDVIAEHGFFNARVSDIAARAGVADGTIYLYFKNKEQILMAAISTAFATFMQRARAEVKKSDDPRQQLHSIAALHLGGLGANRNLAVVFQTELRQSARFLAQFSQHQLKQYFDLVREIVREGQRTGIFRPELSDKIVANCFFGALDEMVTSWILSDHEYPLAGAADAVADVILKGMEKPTRS
jgi:TetR/AcrR family fatty acid metabolism transcriptional regulator